MSAPLDRAKSAEEERRVLAELAASVQPIGGPVLVMSEAVRKDLAALVRLAFEQGEGAEFQSPWAAKGRLCVACGVRPTRRVREILCFVLCERCWT